MVDNKLLKILVLTFSSRLEKKHMINPPLGHYYPLTECSIQASENGVLLKTVTNLHLILSVSSTFKPKRRMQCCHTTLKRGAYDDTGYSQKKSYAFPLILILDFYTSFIIHTDYEHHITLDAFLTIETQHTQLTELSSNLV